MARTTQPPFQITSIEFIRDDVVLVVCANERTARDVLKKNPAAQVQRSEHDDAIGLLFNDANINMLGAIKRS